MSQYHSKFPKCHKKAKTVCTRNRSCIYVNKTRKYCRIGKRGLCSRRTATKCLAKRGCGIYTRSNRTRCRRNPVRTK